MNQEIKQKWIDALRSGKYKQTKGALHNNSGYCCLGVLCEVYKEENPAAVWRELQQSDRVIYEFIPTDKAADSATGILSPFITAWAGLQGPTGLYEHTSLVSHNDSSEEHHRDFNQIADILEKHF